MRKLSGILDTLQNFFIFFFKLPLLLILMILSRHLYGKGNGLIRSNNREISALLWESVSKKLSLVFFKLQDRFSSLVLPSVIKNQAVFLEHLAERIYLNYGTPKAADIWKQSHELHSEIIHKDFEGNVKFLGPEWASVFGHITGLSLFPKMERLQWIPATHKIVFYRNSANSALLKHYSPYFGILKLNKERAEVFDIALRGALSPMHSIDTQRQGILDLYTAQATIEKAYTSTFGNLACLLELDPVTRNRAINFLSPLGFDPKNWFVTFHMRESDVENKLRGADNVDPGNYLAAIQKVLNAGGQVIRIGSKSQTPLKNLGMTHEKLFDMVVSHGRLPEVDVFALSSCKFMVGTSSGPITIPNEFGVPVVHTNATTVGRPLRLRGFMVPQLVTHESDDGAFLMLDEMLRTPLAWNLRSNFNGYRRVANSQEDIAEAVELALNLFTSKGNCDKTMKQNQTSVINSTRENIELQTPIPKQFLDKYSLV